MSFCPPSIDIEAFADGEEVDAAIFAHIRDCPSCLAVINETRRLNDAIRQSARDMRAPEHIVLEAPSSEAPRRYALGRRDFLVGGGAIAASLAGVSMMRQKPAEQVAFAEITSTYFGDFRTLLAASRRLDFAEADADRLLAWSAERVSFNLPVLNFEHVDLRGGRLCWLLERRCAALDFDTQDGGCCLYLASAHGVELPDIGTPISSAVQGLNGVFGQKDGVLYALVGEPAPEQLRKMVSDFLVPPRRASGDM